MAIKCRSSAQNLEYKSISFMAKNKWRFLLMTEEDVKANIRKFLTYEKSCYFHIDNLQVKECY
jgi:hypothetical protein